MKLNKTILATAAIVLPLTIGTGSALAYFTANDAASGSYEVEVGPPKTEIEEDFKDWTKKVKIKNIGEVPVYVRVKAFSGFEGNSNLEIQGDGWRKSIEGEDPEYYYYDSALEPVGAANDKDKTTELAIKIKNIPEGTTDKEEFNVIVVYEKTPAVKYVVDKDGNKKLVPDWDYAIKIDNDPNKFPPMPSEPGGDSGSDTTEDTEDQPKGGNDQ